MCLRANHAKSAGGAGGDILKVHARIPNNYCEGELYSNDNSLYLYSSCLCLLQILNSDKN